jgi:hypothetical protein
VRRTFELFTVDGLAARSISAGEVPSLDHELHHATSRPTRSRMIMMPYPRNDPMERTPLVSKPMLPSRQLTEVLGCVGNDVVIQLHNDAAFGLLVDSNVELHFALSYELGARMDC